MLTFVTLLLGLTTGLRPIELAVGAGIAAVELRLDGRAFATLTAAPWKATADFGAEPEPHEILAIGRNAAGAEVARTRQIVNMPRPPAEATLVLLPGSGGHGRRAKLVWQSALGMPQSASASRSTERRSGWSPRARSPSPTTFRSGSTSCAPSWTSPRTSSRPPRSSSAARTTTRPARS